MIYTWKTKPVKKNRQLEISGRKRLYKKKNKWNINTLHDSENNLYIAAIRHI